LEKGLAAQVAALVVVVGFLCFAGGYVVASGIQKQAGQHLIGENITVNVKAPGQTTYTEVNLNSGMTALDAVAHVIEIKTDLSWPQMGPAIKTLDNRWLMYTINGGDPGVGMVKYQLTGGENIELSVF
jgi:hypothetical protein